MTEHVAKFCVIRLSLRLAARAADEASSHFSWWTGSDLRYQMLPPAPAHVSQMNYIAKTSELHQKLGKHC